MENRHFTLDLLVDRTPSEVFNTILNVRGWWSGLYAETIEGATDKINDEFTFLAGGGAHYSTQKLVEFVPDKEITWLVTDSKLTFIEDQREWNGTRINFKLSRQGSKTKIHFTHIGLVPELECFDSCSSAWSQYIRECLLNALINQIRSEGK